MFQDRVKFLFSAVAIMWILSPLGWAGGSRVGNGNGKPSVKIEIDSNFEVKSELPFLNVKRYSDGIRIEGPMKTSFKLGTGIPSMVGSQKINIRNFKTERPELAKLSKEEMSEFFAKNQWSARKIENPCLKAWTFDGDGVVTAIVTSADGDGYIAAADSTQDAKLVLEKMIVTTKFKKVCPQKK